MLIFCIPESQFLAVMESAQIAFSIARHWMHLWMIMLCLWEDQCQRGDPNSAYMHKGHYQHFETLELVLYPDSSTVFSYDGLWIASK